MKRKDQRLAGLPSLDLLEEAVHLLRDLPLAAYLPFLTGALPFLAALLYFWADMSHGAQARANCAPGAFIVALAFLWLKTWQAVFVSRLKEHLSGLTGDKWTFRRWLRCFFQQAAWQPTSFILLPLSALATLPLGWCVAFYQNLSWTGDGRDEGLRETIRRNWMLTRQWPKQNHMVLLWFSFFSLFVLLNVLMLFNFIPSILKVLLGIDTVWTQGGWSMMNSTLWAACGAVAWCCLDPLIKATYALRCFYGEAVTTGEDLKAEIRAIKQSTVMAGLLLGLLFPGNFSTYGATEAPKPAPHDQTVKLDKSIEEILHQRRYEWRLPPSAQELDEQVAPKGWFQTFLEEITSSVKAAIKSIAKVFIKVREWFDSLFPKPHPTKELDKSGGGIDWMSGLRLLLFVLLALVAAALAIFFWRVWRKQKSPDAVLAQAIPARPDLRDENISAADLPENEWLAMAREQIESGNYRLALRAFYLAGLAHLGDKEYLKITRFKSNHDYVRELGRRTRSKPELQTLFGDTVLDFEKVWYGEHEATSESVGEYRQKVERILGC